MRYLILGCGAAGWRHGVTLQTIGNSNIFAYDTDAVARQKFIPGVPIADGKILNVIRDFRASGNGEPCAVVVATPPESHLPLAAEALKAGCHVLVEKPLYKISPVKMDFPVAQLQQIAESKKLIAMVGYPYRYARKFLDLTAAIHAADDVYSVYSYYGNKGAAHGRENILSRVTVHQINYMRALIRHNNSPIGMEIIDHAETADETSSDFTLYGTICTGHVSSNIVSTQRVHTVYVETSNGNYTWHDDGGDEMYENMHKHFQSCAEMGMPPETPLIDALWDMKILAMKPPKKDPVFKHDDEEDSGGNN